MCEVPVGKYWTVAKHIEQVRTDLTTQFKNEPLAIFILNIRIILSNQFVKTSSKYGILLASMLVTDD